MKSKKRKQPVVDANNVPQPDEAAPGQLAEDEKHYAEFVKPLEAERERIEKEQNENGYIFEQLELEELKEQEEVMKEIRQMEEEKMMKKWTEAFYGSE